MEQKTPQNKESTRPNLNEKPRKSMWAKYKVPIIISGIAVVLIMVGIITGIYWTSIFDHVFIKKITLSETSKSYDLWKKTPIPMYLKIRFFNWTNYQDMVNGVENSKPNFVEMGPYVFREVDYKIPIKWNNNDTFTFHQKKVWHFLPSESKGNLNDIVSNLNPVATTISRLFINKTGMVKKFINKALQYYNETLVIHKTVRELLFDGYDDKLLEYARKMQISKMPFDKFGWFHGRNNSETYDGTFNMLKGQTNIHEMGKVVQWNYSNKTDFYDGKCNNINGFIGDLWPPLLKNKTIAIFVPDICTQMVLKLDNLTDQSGLIGHRFISDDKMFDNGVKNPKKKCYCDKDYGCQPTGTLNVAKCKYDAPVFVSLPHFYLADKSYTEAISGMNPNQKEHEFFLTVEPETGIPLQVKAQLQINLLIENDKSLKVFNNVKKTYVPMIWFTQEAYITSELANEVKFVKILPMLGHVTLFGIGGIGILLIIVAGSVFLHLRKKNEDRQVLLKD